MKSKKRLLFVFALGMAVLSFIYPQIEVKAGYPPQFHPQSMACRIGGQVINVSCVIV